MLDIKRILCLILFLSVFIVNKVEANDLGYFLGGFVAGIVTNEVVCWNRCQQYPPDYYEVRPDMPCNQYKQQTTHQQNRCYKKIWIPGSLQLRCSQGYYNFWGNFVPPDCIRVWVSGYWQCQTY